MGGCDRDAFERCRLVPARSARGAPRRGNPRMPACQHIAAWLRDRAMKLPLLSISPASQPSGRFHCSNSARKIEGSMTMLMHRRRLAWAQDGHFNRHDRRFQHGAIEHVGNLNSAEFDGAAAKLDALTHREWSTDGQFEIDELLAALVAEHDPSAAKPFRGALGLLAECGHVVRLQRGRGRQHLADGDLLAQDRVDRIHQRARREQDRLAPGLALVVGELPDDARGQQHERQRHRECQQQQAVTDAPAFVGNVQGSLLKADQGRRAGVAPLLPAAALKKSAA